MLREHSREVGVFDNTLFAFMSAIFLESHTSYLAYRPQIKSCKGSGALPHSHIDNEGFSASVISDFVVIFRSNVSVVNVDSGGYKSKSDHPKNTRETKTEICGNNKDYRSTDKAEENIPRDIIF